MLLHKADLNSRKQRETPTSSVLVAATTVNVLIIARRHLNDLYYVTRKRLLRSEPKCSDGLSVTIDPRALLRRTR
jgi:hypothetical protein